MGSLHVGPGAEPRRSETICGAAHRHGPLSLLPLRARRAALRHGQTRTLHQRPLRQRGRLAGHGLRLSRPIDREFSLHPRVPGGRHQPHGHHGAPHHRARRHHGGGHTEGLPLPLQPRRRGSDGGLLQRPAAGLWNPRRDDGHAARRPAALHIPQIAGEPPHLRHRPPYGREWSNQGRRGAHPRRRHYRGLRRHLSRIRQGLPAWGSRAHILLGHDQQTTKALGHLPPRQHT